MLWFLLSAVAYRGTRLITKDTFPPVLWLRDRLAGGWRPMTTKEAEIQSRQPGGNLAYPMIEINGVQNLWVTRRSWSPHWLAELLTCPWCASAYVSGALVLVTDCVIGIQWPWLMGGAVWALASLLASRSWA